MQPFVPLSPTGTVAYDELGTSGVSRVRIAKILRFGAPLFFANVAMLKVCCRLPVSVEVRARCQHFGLLSVCHQHV